MTHIKYPKRISSAQTGNGFNLATEHIANPFGTQPEGHGLAMSTIHGPDQQRSTKLQLWHAGPNPPNNGSFSSARRANCSTHGWKQWGGAQCPRSSRHGDLDDGGARAHLADRVLPQLVRCVDAMSHLRCPVACPRVRGGFGMICRRRVCVGVVTSFP